MYIKSLSIRNYRNFKAAKFSFSQGTVNTILGENASGKTNIFQAMRLVLDDSLPLNARYLTANDFNRKLENPRGHWIVIELCFGGLGQTDEDLVMANHALEDNMDNSEGTYTFVYRPKLHIRQKIHDITSAEPIIENRLQALEQYLQTLVVGKEDYEVVAFTRTTVDFSDDDVYQQFVGDFQTGILPDPREEDAALIGSQKPAYFSLLKEVTCTYVKALRNVVNDLKYAKTNPLYKLLSYKSTEITGAENITDTVAQLNSDISNLDQVKELSKNISKTLSDAVGQTYSPELNITSNLPEDIVELVQSLSLLVEDSIGYKGTGNIEDLSLGGANLIYLALKLYEYEMARDRDDKIAHFLLIEEPEAHIHNHIQKTLFKNFASLNTQVFISTHSTQISSVSKISAMNMISRKDNNSEVYWPANELSTDEVVGIERYLDAIRSTLLFAKSVILVEGDAEQILIPELIKKVFGMTLDEMGISLINMDGTVFVHISKLYHEKRIKGYCSILTDKDSAYLEEKTDYADEDYLKKLKDAEANGAIRHDELTQHCYGNNYLSAFFAENTFETELILSDNIELFKNVIPDLYQQQTRINDWKENLDDGDDPFLCHSALFLANKVGKGWFAIKLSEHLKTSTKVPAYILKAISHALKGQNSLTIYKKMIDYRLGLVNQSLDFILAEANYDWGDCLEVVRDIIPDDPALTLMDME